MCLPVMGLPFDAWSKLPLSQHCNLSVIDLLQSHCSYADVVIYQSPHELLNWQVNLMCNRIHFSLYFQVTERSVIQKRQKKKLFRLHVGLTTLIANVYHVAGSVLLPSGVSSSSALVQTQSFRAFATIPCLIETGRRSIVVPVCEIPLTLQCEADGAGRELSSSASMFMNISVRHEAYQIET